MLIMSFLYNFDSLINEQKRYLLFLITILRQMLFVIGEYNTYIWLNLIFLENIFCRSPVSLTLSFILYVSLFISFIL